VASALALTPQAVYLWERGESVPDRERWGDIESAYGLPAGAIANRLSVPLEGPSLAYWIGRWEQATMHLRTLVREQEGLLGEMRERSGDVPISPSEVREREVREATTRAALPPLESADQTRPSAARARRRAGG
jgi:hypothetical protein